MTIGIRDTIICVPGVHQPLLASLWCHVKTVMSLPPPSTPRPVSIKLIVILCIAHHYIGSFNKVDILQNHFTVELEVKSRQNFSTPCWSNL